MANLQKITFRKTSGIIFGQIFCLLFQHLVTLYRIYTFGLKQFFAKDTAEPKLEKKRKLIRSVSQ